MTDLSVAKTEASTNRSNLLGSQARGICPVHGVVCGVVATHTWPPHSLDGLFVYGHDVFECGCIRFFERKLPTFLKPMRVIRKLTQAR